MTAAQVRALPCKGDPPGSAAADIAGYLKLPKGCSKIAYTSVGYDFICHIGVTKSGHNAFFKQFVSAMSEFNDISARYDISAWTQLSGKAYPVVCLRLKFNRDTLPRVIQYLDFLSEATA